MCEVIDLNLSDSDSDGDSIQAKKAKVIKSPILLRRDIGMPTLQDSCMYVVMYCSLVKSGRLFALGEAGSSASQC